MNSLDPDLQSLVARHPFLAGLSGPQVEILTDCAQVRRFDAGQMVFRAGDPAEGFYLLESGSIAVEGGANEGATVTIDTVASGDPLGWSWLFEPFVCQYGARAIEPTIALFIDAIRLAEHRGADLTLGHELFKRMSQVMVRRLTAARRKLVAANSMAQP